MQYDATNIMVIFDSVTGLLPMWCQAITWGNAHILSIWSRGINFSEISIAISKYSFKPMHFEYVIYWISAILSRDQWVKWKKSLPGFSPHTCVSFCCRPGWYWEEGRLRAGWCTTLQTGCVFTQLGCRHRCHLLFPGCHHCRHRCLRSPQQERGLYRHHSAHTYRCCGTNRSHCYQWRKVPLG